jgi:hypothetical protein
MRTHGGDFWRAGQGRRLSHRTPAAPPVSPVSYDAEHCGQSRLSELLTIYDRIDLMPERSGLAWAEKHQISVPDLQELVRLKRVRLVLPYSLADYPSMLIEAIAEVDRDSLVLSRALAAKTITRGQAKEPFLHAPLTSAQRAAVLYILSQSVKDDKVCALASAYGRLFSGQHDMFMMRGALASLGFSAGAYLGDVFFNLGKKDARIELMTCGAGVEWALGLGVSYIPRDFEGYDETWNSHIIASYLSRTKARPVDPVANRMHIISDGLLAVSGVPPLEVARNFHSLPASRFRNLARRLMEATPDATELQGAVEQINADVKAFERRTDRLARWNLGLVLTEGIATVAHHEAGFWASVAAVWLYEKLKDSEALKRMVPETVRNELADASAMLTGLATASSLDAVIVSRSRKAIGSK